MRMQHDLGVRRGTMGLAMNEKRGRLNRVRTLQNFPLGIAYQDVRSSNFGPMQAMRIDKEGFIV